MELQGREGVKRKGVRQEVKSLKDREGGNKGRSRQRSEARPCLSIMLPECGPTHLDTDSTFLLHVNSIEREKLPNNTS